MLPYILILLWIIGIGALAGRGLTCSIILTFIMVFNAITLLGAQYRVYRQTRDSDNAKLVNIAFFPIALLIMTLYYVPGMKWLNFILLGAMGGIYVYWMVSEKEKSEFKKILRDNMLCILICVAVMLIKNLPYQL